jgi:hypothetical protein
MRLTQISPRVIEICNFRDAACGQTDRQTNAPPLYAFTLYKGSTKTIAEAEVEVVDVVLVVVVAVVVAGLPTDSRYNLNGNDLNFRTTACGLPRNGINDVGTDVKELITFSISSKIIFL